MAGFDWYRYAVGGAASRPDSFSKLDPEYASRVASMLAAADQELGPGALRITSAYRSPELQAQLFAGAVKKYGSEKAARKWVAPPGKSKHNFGLAVDFADASGSMLRDPDSREAKWIAQNASRFGLAVPMSWEPWQVELAGSREGGAVAAAGGTDSLAGGAGDDDLTWLSEWAGQTAPKPEDDLSWLRDWASGGVTAAPAQPEPAQVQTPVGGYLPGVAMEGTAADYARATEAQAQRAAQPQTFMEGIQRGLGLGARSVAEGVYSIPAMLAEPAASIAGAITGRQVQSPSQQFSASLPLPSPETPAERITSAVTRGVAGSLGAAGLARGAAGMTTGGTQAAMQEMASGIPAQVMGGAGAGAGAQIAAEAGAGPIGQTAAAIGGAVLGAAIPGARPVASPTARADVAAGKAVGIPVMTTDIAPPRTFIGKWWQRMGEMVPVTGTGGMRAAQQTAREAAIRDVATQFGAAPGVIDDVMKGLTAERSRVVRQYSDLKKGVINSIPGKVPVTNALKAIDDQIAMLRGMKTAEVQPVIAKLTDWRRAIQDQDLPNIERLRAQMGEAFSDPNLASVKSIGEKSLNAIYGPLRQDMGDFIKANGQPRDFTKWSVANKRLADSIAELEATALKRALDKGEMTPETVRALLMSAKPSDVKLLFKNLGQSGKARARAAIIQDMVEKSTTDNFVSPEKFVSQMQKNANQIGVFFEGSDLKAVKGLQRALEVTRRAGQSGVSGPTGVQAVPMVGAAVLTDLVGGAGAAIAAGATYGGAARLSESAAVRNLLIALGSAKPGSANELNIIKRLAEIARAAESTEAPQ